MLNITVTLGIAKAVALAIQEGLGIGFVSELFAARSASLGRAVEAAVEGFDLHHALYFMRSWRTPMAHSQRALCEFMQVTQLGCEAAGK
jgi:DNA-binding transcriptional LysR family regulator